MRGAANANKTGGTTNRRAEQTGDAAKGIVDRFKRTYYRPQRSHVRAEENGQKGNWERVTIRKGGDCVSKLQGLSVLGGEGERP